jgi:hypothetical protein
MCLINSLNTIRKCCRETLLPVGSEDIFKLVIGIEHLHKICIDNGVRVVNFATSKHLTVKSMMFPHPNIHICTWASQDWKTHNQIGHVLVFS